MNTVEIIKALVGPMLVIIVGWLTYAIVQGNVQERNSFGLMGVIAILSSLATAYAGWAYFSKDHPSEQKPPEQK